MSRRIAFCWQATSERLTRERLAIMEETSDGFKIAEKDMELRGPGEVMGTRQAGVPTFRVGNIIRDLALLEIAKREADRILTMRQSSREAGRLIQLARELSEYGLASIG
jgi:ATP-dependent DNA helicase RecG